MVDTGSTVHCFRDVGAAVAHALKLLKQISTGKSVERRVFSDSGGLHDTAVNNFDQDKIEEYVRQIHIHTSLTLSVYNAEREEEERVTIRKSYLI